MASDAQLRRQFACVRIAKYLFNLIGLAALAIHLLQTMFARKSFMASTQPQRTCRHQFG